MTPVESSLPSHVTLVEVGPRDGFQVERTFIPTDLKLEIIRGLVAAGLRHVQIASFVHPTRVPQMADAEAICQALLRDQPTDVTYSGLVLNTRGVERALATGLRVLDVSIAPDEGQSASNAGMSVADARVQAREMIARAKTAGCTVHAGLQVVFGYREPGDVPLERVIEMARELADHGADTVSLADSTGMGDPRTVEHTVAAVRDAIGTVPLVLHLHDTRGMGLANVVAGLRQGVARFDTSLGGMGGCPFIAGATGNIPTDDTAHMLARMGIHTGIDVAAVGALARQLEAFLGKRFDGKLHALPGTAA
ncbi:MAG: hydroxymethylglutaryl-CoA lyase [Gemmatimonadaceae bacterium]|jgi:hydroxymethylglutaryl-CoA lyase|nr:hydroxymethylglutaryl-CoA lyase [Gemmatimonadaceae bacterium]